MSDKPRSSIKPVNIDDLKSGWHTKQHNIKNLAKEIGINRWALKSYLDRTLKPGIKVFGKRYFSNIDNVAEFLAKKQREIQSKPPESKIIKGPVTQIGQLKNLAKVHEIKWKTIQNALDAGANPKSLIRTMNSETIPSEVIDKHFQDVFNKKNAERRTRDKFVKSTGNKIVKTGNLSNRGSLRMFKAISEGVPKKEADAARRRLIKKSQKARMKTGHMRHWVPDYSSGKPKEPRLQKMSKSARNAQKLTQKNLARRANLQIKQLAKLGREAKRQDLWNRFTNVDQGDYETWKRKSMRRWARLERIEDGRARQLKIRNLASGLKGAATQLGAGIALNALTDKFVKPHTDELGRRAGIKLKKFVDRLEEKNAKKKKEK